MSTPARDDQKPHEKMPEHHSTDKQPKNKEEKIDAQMADSFPASDPPSFSGGNHTIGAPKERESEAPTGDSTLQSIGRAVAAFNLYLTVVSEASVWIFAV